jgi:hypothetical protein
MQDTRPNTMQDTRPNTMQDTRPNTMQDTRPNTMLIVVLQLQHIHPSLTTYLMHSCRDDVCMVDTSLVSDMHLFTDGMVPAAGLQRPLAGFLILPTFSFLLSKPLIQLAKMCMTVCEGSYAKKTASRMSPRV